MIIRSANLDPFFLSLDTLYQRGYLNAEVTYPKWTQTVMSNSKTTLHGWLDRLPTVREWIGPRQVENLIAQNYSLTNKKYELTFAVERTDIDDDQYNLYGPSAEMLGMQAAAWPDNIMTSTLEAGPTSLTFDGADFFSTTHPKDTANASAGTQSNLFTGGFTANNVSTVRAAMRNLVGRDGKPLGMNMTDVMVPPALEQSALQMANAEFIVASNGVNAATGGQTNVLKGSFNVIVNPKLTSATTWYAFDNRWPIKALIWQLRQAPEFTYLVNPTDQTVFSNDQYTYGIRARGIGGYGLWFMAAQVTT